MELQRRKVVGQSQAKADRHNDEACALYDKVAESLQILVGLAAESAQSQLISALDDFQTSFRVFKRESALLDFDDLLYFARDLLRTHPAVRAALADRYRHVLVDEFQDTDPLQCEILFLLCGEYGADKPWQEQRFGRVSCSWWEIRNSRYTGSGARTSGATSRRNSRSRDNAPRTSSPLQIISVRVNPSSISSINALLLRWARSGTSRWFAPLHPAVRKPSRSDASRSAKKARSTRYMSGANSKRKR